MEIAQLSSDENLRLKNLNSYNILDTEDEDEYDDLIELASQICNCPIALITFVDNDRQWFKAKKNVDATQTSRNIAFCSHTILQGDVMVIKDARTNKKFHDNPLVTGELQIGFYAGAPIVSREGFKLGSVCVIDHTKKEDLSENQKKSLTIIAGQVSKLLELRAQNKLILKQSEEQIKAEKKISQLTISESDSKDTSIGYELHENLAQTLTAIKLFIETAENSKDLKKQFLQKSKETIVLLIDEVKNLSKSIIPTTLKNADYYWIIQEYAVHFGKKNNIDISFGETAIIQSKNTNIGINLFRIVQKQLEIADLYGADFVIIDIKADAEIIFKFSYNINNPNKDITQLLNNISTRVELMDGTLSQENILKESIILIQLPFDNL
jgi:hypothetical protein